MIGKRIKKARNDRGYTLVELGTMVGKSSSVISRLENQESYKLDPELLYKIADALGITVSYLMKPTEVTYQVGEDIADVKPGEVIDVIVEDDDMSPELPEGAIVKIRALMPNETLQTSRFYFIEFNGQRKFRMATDDDLNGLGFLPHNLSEKRISYDMDYVKVIGKVITMKVIFEDSIEYKVD